MNLKLIANKLRTNHEYLFLVAILGLAFYIAFIPHIDYPYPVHMDEWHHLGNAKTMMATGNVNAKVPYLTYSIKGVTQNLEAGSHLFIGLFQSVSGISWMALFRYLPPVIFMFTVLAAYLFGKRQGFGWEAALMTCLIITTIGILGPGFLVPVSFGMPFIVLSLYLAYNFRTFWSYVVVFLLMSFLLCLHPPTAIGLGILLAPYILLNLKNAFKHALGLSLAAGVPLLPAVVVVDWDVIIHYMDELFASHKLASHVAWPDMVPDYGYLGVACCILGVFVLARRGGKEAWGLVAGLVLLGLALVLYRQFQYGLVLMYNRMILYTMLVMGLIGGCGLAAIKNLKLPEKFACRPKPVFMVRNVGNVMCLAVIAVIFALAIPDRQNEDYYHKIDDDDYEAFVWIEKNLGDQYEKAILDHFQAVALAVITGKDVYSDMGSTKDSRASQTYHFLNSGCTDTEFLKKNGISIVYTWQQCNNPDLNEVRENVYVLMANNRESMPQD